MQWNASVSFSLFLTPGNSTGPYVKWAPLVMVLVKSLRKNRRFWRKMWWIWCPWNLFQQSYHLSALGKQNRNSTKTSVKDVITLSSQKSNKSQSIGKLDDARWGWDRRLAPKRSRSARRTDAQISIKYLSWHHQEKCEFHYVFTAYSFWNFFVELILPVLLQIVYFCIGCTSRQLELKVTAQ